MHCCGTNEYLGFLANSTRLLDTDRHSPELHDLTGETR